MSKKVEKHAYYLSIMDYKMSRKITLYISPNKQTKEKIESMNLWPYFGAKIRIELTVTYDKELGKNIVQSVNYSVESVSRMQVTRAAALFNSLCLLPKKKGKAYSEQLDWNNLDHIQVLSKRLWFVIHDSRLDRLIFPSFLKDEGDWYSPEDDTGKTMDLGDGVDFWINPIYAKGEEQATIKFIEYMNSKKLFDKIGEWVTHKKMWKMYGNTPEVITLSDAISSWKQPDES